MVGLLSPSDYAGYADEGRRLAVDVPNVTPMDAARFIAEATPIIGDAMAAKEIYDEATSENPNWAMVGALGGAAVLGLFPGIGDAAAKAVKSGARGLLDTAKRVEVDPNAMGSLLGNVRLKPKGDVADEATSFPVMQGRSRKGLDNFFNPDGLSWGTTSRETAEQFAGRNEVYWPNRTPPESSVEFSGDVYDLNFNLKNPMDVDISQTLWDRNKELALVSEAKSAGHDGLRISHPSGKVDYVAFDPSQVSRATPPSPAQEGSGLLAPAKPTAAELRRQANIQRFGYDPSEASAPPSRAATEDAGFESYLEQVNPGGKRIAAEDRPNLAMGDMYGMLPKGSEVVGSNNGVTFHRGSDGNYYATAFNPDVGEEDVIGYITNRGDGTELAVVQEMQGKGVGGELQYLFRNENPNAPTGGLTEAGEASLSKTYQRLAQEGLLAPAKPAGIRAYHGSPHSFDKFSMDKIGTGEGAQAYGHGLYFAEAEDVAKKYRDDLAGWGSAGAGRTLEAVGGDVDRAILETQQKLDRLLERNASGAFKGAERNFNMQRQIQEDKINQLKGYKDTGGFSAGSMYEVNINANPDDFLDWDAPAPQQSERVRKALTSIANSDPEVMSNFREAMARGDSGSIYEAILQDKTGTVVGNQAGAAKRLREAGIPGIKYKDAGSRGTDAATRNFVVFDENLINIVKKYGIAGAATMLGVSAMDVEQAMAQGYQPSSQQPQGLLAQGAQ